MGLCKAFFMGRTCNDITLKYISQNQTAVTDINFAVETGFGKYKKTYFFRLKAFGKTAQNMEKYVPKGTKLVVETEPVIREWTNKDGKKVKEHEYNILNWDYAESKYTQHTNEQPSHQQQEFTQPGPGPAQAPNADDEPWMQVPDGFDDGSLPFV